MYAVLLFGCYKQCKIELQVQESRLASKLEQYNIRFTANVEINDRLCKT
jgi:hypothetical protein